MLSVMRNRAKIGVFAGILAAGLALASCGCPRHCACVPSMVRDSVYLEIRDSVIIRDTLLSVQLPADTAQVQAAVPDTARAETSAAAAIAYLEAGSIRLDLWNKPAPILVPVTLPAIKYHVERTGKLETITRTVEVEKKLTAWQEIQMKAGRASLLLLALSAIAGIVWVVLRLKGWHLKKK